MYPHEHQPVYVAVTEARNELVIASVGTCMARRTVPYTPATLVRIPAAFGGVSDPAVPGTRRARNRVSSMTMAVEAASQAEVQATTNSGQADPVSVQQEGGVWPATH